MFQQISRFFTGTASSSSSQATSGHSTLPLYAQQRHMSPSAGIQTSTLPLYAQQRQKEAFVTELTGAHRPTEVDYRGIPELIEKLESTDSKKETENLKEALRTQLEAMQRDLYEMRDTYFEVKNPNTCSPYGVLKEGRDGHDRDRYIRRLVVFSESIQHLQDIRKADEASASAYKSYMPIEKPSIDLISTGLYAETPIMPVYVMIHRSTGLYGDLQALEKLQNGEEHTVKLPDLLYNKRISQFG